MMKVLKLFLLIFVTFSVSAYATENIQRLEFNDGSSFSYELPDYLKLNTPQDSKYTVTISPDGTKKCSLGDNDCMTLWAIGPKFAHGWQSCDLVVTLKDKMGSKHNQDSATPVKLQITSENHIEACKRNFGKAVNISFNLIVQPINIDKSKLIAKDKITGEVRPLYMREDGDRFGVVSAYYISEEEYAKSQQQLIDFVKTSKFKDINDHR